MTAGPYEVLFTPTAEDDLTRLPDLLLDRVRNLHTLTQVAQSMQALRQAIDRQLAAVP